MRILSVLLLSLFFLLFVPSRVLALSDPLSVPNNKFGIHIVDENDLEDAARLINSSGGEWGYVKLVISESERDRERWQRVFDRMRELKLIPIIRIATSVEGDVWRKPDIEDARGWAEFLDSLNWVVKNRYVVIFNEPNHAKEWGGKVDPQEYAEILKSFSATLKERSADFFILNAGLDASAPNMPPRFMDEAVFIREMLKAEPDIFEFIDGWASHSYPNPAFSGSVFDSGRGSIRTYEWELDLLRGLNISRSLPVFIVETGWSHQNISEIKVADFYRHAFEEVWNDSRIVAIVPFLLNYQASPFQVFSWKVLGATDEFLPSYWVVQQIGKVKGTPAQVHSIEVLGYPKKYPRDFPYEFVLSVKNIGQSVWASDDGFEFIIDGGSEIQIVQNLGGFKVGPGELLAIPLKVKAQTVGEIHVAVVRDRQVVSDIAELSGIEVVTPLGFLLGDKYFLLARQNILGARVGLTRETFSWHYFR